MAASAPGISRAGDKAGAGGRQAFWGGPFSDWVFRLAGLNGALHATYVILLTRHFPSRPHGFLTEGPF